MYLSNESQKCFGEDVFLLFLQKTKGYGFIQG